MFKLSDLTWLVIRNELSIIRVRISIRGIQGALVGGILMYIIVELYVPLVKSKNMKRGEEEKMKGVAM